ncbi:MAG: hypothetical protein AB1896_03320 [Thermodesulfobacteriota bacterium]
MGYLVLWLGWLAICLLAVAVVTSAAAKSPRVHRPRFWALFVTSMFLLFNAALTVFSGLLLAKENLEPTWLFPYLLLQTLAFLAGAFLVLRKGFRKTEEGPGAKAWPPAVLFVALGLIFFFTWGAFHLMDLDMRVHQANYRSMILADLVRTWPPEPPADQNALYLYDEVYQSLFGQGVFPEKEGRPGEVPAWLYESTEADFIPTSTEVVQYLDEGRPALALARQAAARPWLYFDLDVHQLIYSETPSLYKLSHLAKLLNAEARLKALRGDPEEALADIAAIGAMSGQLFRLPSLITVLTGAATERTRAAALEFVLAQTAFPQEGMIPTPIKPSRPLAPYLVKSVLVERAAILQFMATADHQPGSTGGSGGWSKEFGQIGEYSLRFWRVFLLPEDLRSLERAWAAVSQAAGEPYPQGVKRLLALEKSVATEPQGLFTKNYFMNPLPGYLRLYEAEARRRLMDLALAVTAYKADTDLYPKNMEDLVPSYIEAVPQDPFDGRPLKMEVLDEGLHLYSVGVPAETVPSFQGGPLRFYLGLEAYEEYRMKPVRLEREKKKGS